MASKSIVPVQLLYFQLSSVNICFMTIKVQLSLVLSYGGISVGLYVHTYMCTTKQECDAISIVLTAFLACTVCACMSQLSDPSMQV